MANFMGKEGFQWFVGVVEDRNDPKTLGRVRVRCLGYHTPDLTKLPTADLPWGHVMNPITSATVSGVGQTPLGLVEGSWVIGFFQDHGDAQMPIIIGSLPGVPSALSSLEDNRGFQDTTNANYPKYIETDMNRHAVTLKENGAETNPHSSLTLRRADVDRGVSIADIDEQTNIAGAGNGSIDVDLGDSWDEPVTTYAAEYPKNHVYETEGGHIREYDDTIGAQRIHERHAAGTGYEIDNDGTKITRVKKDQYHIVSNDDYVHIQGAAKQTVDKGLKVFVNKNAEEGNNYNIEVGAGANVTVQVNQGDINMVAVDGDINMKMSDDCNIDVGGNFNVTVAGDASETIAGKKDELVTGNSKKTGARIDLN